MAKIDPRVLQKLRDKLNISSAYAYKLIQGHANEHILSNDLAAISLAMANGINIQRFASPDQIAAIRDAKSGKPIATASNAAAASRPAARAKASVSRKSLEKAKRGTEKAVFVIHGRNEKVRKAVFSLLRALELKPLEWSTLVAKTKKGAPYVGEILEAAFKEASAVVVLLTPDDLVMLREDLHRKNEAAIEKKLIGQARPNVLFEAGMAFGRMPNKTIIVQVGKIKAFSDVVGRHYVNLSNKVASKIDLATRLGTAGCVVDMSGTDWQENDPAFDETPAKNNVKPRAGPRTRQ